MLEVQQINDDNCCFICDGMIQFIKQIPQYNLPKKIHDECIMRCMGHLAVNPYVISSCKLHKNNYIQSCTTILETIVNIYDVAPQYAHELFSAFVQIISTHEGYIDFICCEEVVQHYNNKPTITKDQIYNECVPIKNTIRNKIMEPLKGATRLNNEDQGSMLKEFAQCYQICY